MDNFRVRKGALFDKKRSFLAYQGKNDLASFEKRITSGSLEDLNVLKSDDNSNKNKEIPLPPKFTGDVKKYNTKHEKPRLFFIETASVIRSFDKFGTIDQESSLINLDTFFSKFESQEIHDITIKDVLTFDIDEFEKFKNKIEEFKKIGNDLKDNELINFFSDKLNEINENKEKAEITIMNIDKVEEIVLLNETLKVFFNKKK